VVNATLTKGSDAKRPSAEPQILGSHAQKFVHPRVRAIGVA
jgi:hypothetical protein